MNCFVGSLSVLSLGAVLLILTARLKRISVLIFLASLAIGCTLGFLAALHVLSTHTSIDYRLAWKPFWGEFQIGVDPLSAFFILAITILFFLAGVYGAGYLRDDEHQKNLTGHFVFYHVLLISLLLIVTARNVILFLWVWEAMSVSSYFLITFHDEKEQVRRAGYLYLIATHTGTFCLWVMFLLLGHQAGSMNFDHIAASQVPQSLTGLIFVLGIVGFGLKAGFIPFHIWLPHAHPAAPSHISAVLSGVMIKMGIYGLMRLIFLIKQPPEWCAVVLLAIGIISGVMGVLYALGQHEIKRLLAYHSIENIGIITLGLGIGLWGQIHGHTMVALIGYAGGLLHVFNHAVFKGLLFLSAGSVIKAAHTGEIDHLGGILKRLPWTGHFFLVGSLSICGLPLFNGFISEWLVYRALFEGVLNFRTGAVIWIALAVTSLALIGGLALLCFAKAFGVIFLGHSRCGDISHLKENPGVMLAPMAVLALICFWIGISPNTMVSFSLQGAAHILSTTVDSINEHELIGPLSFLISGLMMLIGIIAFLYLLKRVAVRSLPVERTETWGCGYAAATARMQYTASSFAEPILRIFRNALYFRIHGHRPMQTFPEKTEVASCVVDASEDFLFRPLFQWMRKFLARFKIIQCGYSQVYLLYIFLFLLTLLIWKMV